LVKIKGLAFNPKGNTVKTKRAGFLALPFPREAQKNLAFLVNIHMMISAFKVE
jgi:hypothetical protein